MKKTLPDHAITFVQFPIGCDPEFFFSKDGEIIGSEKVIPKEGLDNSNNKIVIDGVQAELNPAPSGCRALLADNIKKCFYEVQKQIAERKDISVDFSQTIKVDKTELSTLEPKNRVLGCSPSKNAYNKKNQISVKNGSKYYYRSAGGHIHLGKAINTETRYANVNSALDNEKTLIPLLDAILGNTCVLIDRDPGNIQRRKVYGRAGEYRTPKHGIEYRTLSNFWLQSYPLMSFVTGLARQAVLILADSTKQNNYAKELLKLIKRSEIKKAINNNDFELAMKNFEKIADLLVKITPIDTHHFPIRVDNLAQFKHFIKKGTSYWFKENPIEHWTKQIYGGGETPP